MQFEPPLTEDRSIWDIWLSMYRLPAMSVADELGIFQALESGPASTDDVAKRLGLNRRATEILICMLTALELVILRDGRNELPDISRTYLLPHSPFYWGPLLRSLGVSTPQHFALVRALRAVNSMPNSLTRMPATAWESGKLEPAQAESIARIMHVHSLPAFIGAVRSGVFEGAKRLLDVGGGSGAFSIVLAQHYRTAECTVMELPAACDVTRKYIEDWNVSDRVNTCSIDMFRDAWPCGYDAVFFSNVFHDWSLETNLALACRAYNVLPSGGRIFVHEMLLAEDGSGPITTAAFSMLMLFGTKGQQYSAKQLRTTLEKAGFGSIAVYKTYGYYSVLRGQKN